MARASDDMQNQKTTENAIAAAEARAREVNAMGPTVDIGENWYQAAARYMNERDEAIKHLETAIRVCEEDGHEWGWMIFARQFLKGATR